MAPWGSRREVARGVLRSSPKPEKRSIFCHRKGIENFCRLFSTHPWANVFESHAWPAPATYHRPCCEICVTRGWVGAPNERAPFRIHDAVVSFVDRYLSRTRNLAASIKHVAEFFLGRSWPNICPREVFFFRIFWKVWIFFF